MKNICLFFALGIFLYSCSNDNSLTNQEDSISLDTSKTQNLDKSQQVFTKTLSKAVYENIELRNFIKSEALSMFDMDYDILYHRIKDKEVDNGKTFRDYLLSYIENDEEYQSYSLMEKSAPLITIYIPDLLNITGFNAETWDTSNNQIAVAYELDKNTNIYEDGLAIGEIEPGFIPKFPILYVKNNTKVFVVNKAETRAGTIEYSYNYIKPIYENKNPTTRSSDSSVKGDLTNYAPFLKNELDKTHINERVIDSYYENKKALDKSIHTNFAQRDYIYYGITAENNEGAFIDNIEETIFRFQVNPLVLHYIMSSTDSNDGSPHLDKVIKEGGRDYTYEDIVKRIWSGGVFDITFNMLISQRTSVEETNINPYQTTTTINFIVKPSSLFAIETYNRNKKDKKIGASRKYTYSVLRPTDDLKSLWYYPKVGNSNIIETRSTVRTSQEQLPSIKFMKGWNLSKTAANIYIRASEIGTSKGNVYHKHNMLSYFVNNNNSEINTDVNTNNNEGISKAGYKIGYGTNYTQQLNASFHYTFNESDYMFGGTNYTYSSPIIMKIIDNDVYLKTINLGGLNLSIIPQYKEQ